MPEPLKQADFGVLGIAVMGENLAMNMEDHGFSVAVCNLRSDRVTPFMQRNAGKKFIGAHTLQDFVKALKPPRRVMLMVKAGDPWTTPSAAQTPAFQGRHRDRRRQFLVQGHPAPGGGTDEGRLLFLRDGRFGRRGRRAVSAPPSCPGEAPRPTSS